MRSTPKRLFDTDTNILLGKTFTSTAAVAGGSPESYMTDGNVNTRWISASEDNVTVTADMQSTYTLNRLVIVWAGDCTNNYAIDISTDNVNWSTICTGQTDGISYQQTVTITSFSNTPKGRYLRVRCIDRHNPAYGNSIWEIEAYGLRDGTVPAPPAGTITGFTATAASASQVNLSWNYSGSAISTFTLTRNGTPLATATGTSYSDSSGLSAGTTYNYQVTGTFAAGGTTNTATYSVTTPAAPPPPATGEPTWPLQVSTNGRFLVGANGAPFVWQGDTAWALFCRTTREEAVQYLDARKNQGFTVIQASVLFEPNNGFPQANSYGVAPLMANSVSSRNVAYWDHVDYIVQQAEARGMYIAMLPGWSEVIVRNGILTTGNAQEYGQFLGARYKNNKIIWVTGGDDQSGYHTDIWSLVARGIAIGTSGGEDYSKVIMSYHPRAPLPSAGQNGSSSGGYQNITWLDFNMCQSGHCGGLNSYNLVATDYGMSPVKPTLDGEPPYEGHPKCWDPNQGYFTAQEVRAGEYTAVFAGGFGFTYGHHSVWQMYTAGRTGVSYPVSYWPQALYHEVAGQMIHLKKLLLSRPFLTRIPDQGCITSSQNTSFSRIQATRNNDGSYIMVYTGAGSGFTVNLDKLAGTTARSWWYNPRTGAASDNGTFTSAGAASFTTPTNEDWVLVLDDIAAGFGTPGV